MAVCVAVIGKENNPLYISCAKQEQELSLHFTVHTSLDVADEKLNTVAGAKTSSAATDNRELYLGSLYVSEHQKVYGYATNTKIKFVIVVDNSNTTLRDNEIRQMFRKLHTAYTNVVANPFFTPGECISSKKFDTTARSIMGF